MKVTITEYRNLPVDGNADILPIGGLPSASQVMTGAGNSAALADETRFVRVATDTAIHIKQGTGVSTSDPMYPVGVEFFAAFEGTVLSILAA